MLWRLFPLLCMRRRKRGGKKHRKRHAQQQRASLRRYAGGYVPAMHRGVIEELRAQAAQVPSDSPLAGVDGAGMRGAAQIAKAHLSRCVRVLEGGSAASQSGLSEEGFAAAETQFPGRKEVFDPQQALPQHQEGNDDQEQEQQGPGVGAQLPQGDVEQDADIQDPVADAEEVEAERHRFLEHLRKVITGMPRGKSCGPGGFYPDWFRVVFYRDTPAWIEQEFATSVERTLAGLLDDLSLHDEAGSNLFALYKTKVNDLVRRGGTDLLRKFQRVLEGNASLASLPEEIQAKVESARQAVRPICLTHSLRRIAGMTFVKMHISRLKDAVGLAQLAAGHRGGAEQVPLVLQALLERDRETLAVLQLDFRNAFNEIMRKVWLKAAGDAVPEWRPYLRGFYVTAAEIFVRHEDGSLRSISSDEGGQQGDPTMPFGFAIAIRPLLERIQAFVPEGVVMSVMDDIHVMASPAELHELCGHLEEWVGEYGLELRWDKCSVYSMGADVAAAGDWGEIKVVPSDQGIIASGIPVGTDDFIRTWVSDYIDVLIALLELMEELPKMHHKLLVLRACYIPRADYLARSIRPDLVREHLERYDNAVMERFMNWIGEGEGRPAHVDVQASLPIRLAGFGLRKVAPACDQAYVGRWVLAAGEGLGHRVPRFLAILENAASGDEPICESVAALRGAYLGHGGHPPEPEGRGFRVDNAVRGIPGVTYCAGYAPGEQDHDGDADTCAHIRNLPCGNPEHGADGEGEEAPHDLACLLRALIDGAPTHVDGDHDPALPTPRWQRLVSHVKDVDRFRDLFTCDFPSAEEKKLHRARLLGMGGKGGGSWLMAIPASPKLTWQDKHLQQRLRSLLGLKPVAFGFLPQRCLCGGANRPALRPHGHHHLETCASSRGRITRHNQTMNEAVTCIKCAGEQHVMVEEIIQGEADHRMDVVHADYVNGKDAWVDITVTNSCNKSQLSGASKRVGYSVRQREQAKHAKYDGMLENAALVAFALDANGRWGVEAQRYMSWLADQAYERLGESKAVFKRDWTTRISLKLQMAVARTAYSRALNLRVQHQGVDAQSLVGQQYVPAGVHPPEVGS
jgi:hypothetical protein